ncbi:hypothetical protein PFISCL1PPCAC_2799, partial [Pristionchus fissidentatus]
RSLIWHFGRTFPTPARDKISKVVKFRSMYVPLWGLVQVLSTTCNLLVYLVMSSKFREVAVRYICFWRKPKSL